MRELIRHICDRLGEGQSVAIATIVQQEGSSPRGAGSKMVIHGDGSIQGTIGGGKVEARAITTGLKVLANGASVILDFDLSGDVMGDMDMVCGGRLRVLVERIDGTNENLALWSHAARCIKDRRRFFLVTCLGGADTLQTVAPERFVLHADGSILGGSQPTCQRPTRILDHCEGLSAPLELNLDGETLLVEPFRSPETVFLFGAGHVSQQVAVMAAATGFQVVVLDDRPEFANRRRFPDADDVRVIDAFDKAFAQIKADRHAYVIIVTRGHLHDKVVLEQALGTRAAYIGMIGSRRKRDAIYQTLMDQGTPAEDLQRVFCPIGLNIGAQTPEEIALSIVAELVSVRSKVLGAGDTGMPPLRKEQRTIPSLRYHQPGVDPEAHHAAMSQGREPM